MSILSFLLLSVVPLPLLPQFIQTAQPMLPVRVNVGGAPVLYPANLQPFRENGVTMVPVRPTLEALGATVVWNQQSGTVSGARDCHTVTLQDGDGTAQVDGAALPMRRSAESIGGELYAPLRPLAEALSAHVTWDPESQTAQVTPPDQATGRQALLTLTFDRPGTLVNPATYRGPAGTMSVNKRSYQWVLDSAGAGDQLTWTFLPAGGGPAQAFTVTRTGGRLLAGSDTADISARMDQPSLLGSWDYEQAVRGQLGKVQGVLTGSDLNRVSALTLPAGTGAVSDLCHFPSLSALTLEDGLSYSSNFLDAALSRAPQLQSLRLKSPQELTVDVPLPASTEMPYRVETPHAIFLGDQRMSLRQLSRYAAAFEQTGIPELNRDTGLYPTRRKVVFQIYGDEEGWNTATASLPVWGYFTGQEDRIYLAHWRTPETINTVLLYHEYFHWLAWEEGRVSLPTWLNEGLAHNLSWRLEAGSTDFATPFSRRQWLIVKGHPETPVPQLATYQKQDEYTITAVAYLLSTRGRDDLVRLFQLTRAGTDFPTAFEKAFGVDPASFIAEYGAHVAELRSSAG